MKLLDSTFLAHYFRGEERVKNYLEENEDDLATTTINLKEMAVGVHTIDDPSKEEFLSDFEWLQIIPFEEDHAYLAGKMEAELREDTKVNTDKINSLTGDILIGAVAKDLDATVVTENIDDFKLLGVDTERY